MDVYTDHGAYFTLPVCAEDNPPAGAVLAVFHESGERVGYASPRTAYAGDGTRLGPVFTLTHAVRTAADRDAQPAES